MSEITSQITVNDLFEKHGVKLSLSWISGQAGRANIIIPEESEQNSAYVEKDDLDAAQQVKPASLNTAGGKSLVGYLNLIHPHQIQVIGGVELKYIEGLRDITRHDAVKQLFKHDPACIIIADDKRAPAFLKRKCNERNVPLFLTPVSSTRLTDFLHYYLVNLFADLVTLHGVFMEVMSIGVLIAGPSGIGKSELALELITRGHCLIADDAPQFSKIAPDIINGTCPDALLDFLEVRGLGVINIRKLYGDSAIKSNKYLRLIVRLEPMEKDQMLQLDRLEGSYRSRKLLDMEIPEITLPVAPGRNLAILLECAVRNHSLRMSGYNASQEFVENQQSIIEQNGG
ncbi:MAG: HPr(Ser) kinase/phosphatase [Gammaproteobacteria bacterium]|nr:HPr(Ser) kinase/phosphatase [Gammaproteobacteria bacterium]